MYCLAAIQIEHGAQPDSIMGFYIVAHYNFKFEEYYFVSMIILKVYWWNRSLAYISC